MSHLDIVKSVHFREKKGIGEKGKKINVVLDVNGQNKKIYHQLYELTEAISMEDAMELLEEIKQELLEYADDNFDSPENPINADGTPKYSYQAVFHFMFQGWKSGNIVNLNMGTKLLNFTEDYGFMLPDHEYLESDEFDVPESTDKVTKIMINMYPFDEVYSYTN